MRGAKLDEAMKNMAIGDVRPKGVVEKMMIQLELFLQLLCKKKDEPNIGDSHDESPSPTGATSTSG